jgi:tetratricopeptide (TPR) repeat protein
MSRSIHATRRELKRERNPERRERLKEQLWRKRRIKLGTRGHRSGDRAPRGAEIRPPVLVLDQGPQIHYPASAADLEQLIARLPQGVLEGVGSIELSLGRDAQWPRRDGDWIGEPDPLTRRHGFERLPGVFSGRCLGQYIHGPNRIRVFGLVSERRLGDDSPWGLYLRLHMLATFVHEVAHHDDLMRSARGRGRGETHEDHEIYAQRREHEWTSRFVLPYLEKTYPEDVAALVAWVEAHGGCKLPLALIAGNPRTSVRGGFLTTDGVFGGVPEAVERLARDVAAGLDRRAARVHFAREIHYGDRFALALDIVESVLQDHFADLEALSLKADVLEHLERYDEAEVVARTVLDRDPGSRDAWQTLSYVFENQKRWSELLVAADRSLELAESPWQTTLHQRARARALIGLGETTRARAAIDELEQRSANGRIQAKRLRELLAAARP